MHDTVTKLAALEEAASENCTCTLSRTKGHVGECGVSIALAALPDDWREMLDRETDEWKKKAAQEHNRANSARNDRDEAREWVERMQREARVLTCVYCGHAYEPGTPAHGTQTLTDHIKVCEKHPLRQAEEERDQLQKALVNVLLTIRKDHGGRWLVKNGKKFQIAVESAHAVMPPPIDEPGQGV